MSLLLPAVLWGVQLEWPQEVVGLLEGWSNSPDLVDEVLNAVDALLSKDTSDDAVVSQRESGAVDLSVATLVDESADIVTGWVSIGDVRLDSPDHVDGGTVEADKHSVVDLSESEQLHDLLAFGVQFVDTRANATS